MVTIQKLAEKYKAYGVTFLQHGGMCPTQVRATIQNYHLYYRARHGEFTCCVADTFDHAVEAGIWANLRDAEGVVYFTDGIDPTEGYVPEETYAPIVDTAIEFTLSYIDKRSL